MKIKITSKCRFCGGDGTNPDSPGGLCPACSGEGQITETMEVKSVELPVKNLQHLFDNGEYKFWELKE